MNFKKSSKLTRIFVVGIVVIAGIFSATVFPNAAFADNWCLGPLACSAVGGNGGKIFSETYRVFKKRSCAYRENDQCP